MSIAVIDNIKKYLGHLSKTLAGNGLINDPTKLKQFVIVHQKDGVITGWEIKGRKVIFSSEDYLDCDEYGSARPSGCYIEEFSYHFQPRFTDLLLSYRIDLEKGNLHLNPAPSIEPRLKHRIPPEELSFNIENFNSLLAIHVAMKYLSCGVYPTDDNSGIYDKVIDGVRGQIK